METDTGLTQDGEVIEGFVAQCIKCASVDVSIEYEFNYYGGMTGYDQSLYIECRSCGIRTDLDT